ncbi:MAG: hypothetical protein HFF69_13845 [Oscillospiraceae bacterium]|jgi:hypothetical protein|nr:hypothetical protein [Oscillospiraceae bacterium]
MNYTQNHHLPQWIKSDPIRMEDFNDAMASIESGLNTADTALSKAGAAQSAADSAQSTASIAQSMAAVAHNVALEKPYLTGRYTGNGGTKAVSTGFQPSFLIITGAEAGTDLNSYLAAAYVGMTAGNTLATRCKLTSTGFVLQPRSDANGTYPDLNQNGRVYEYIAFK